MAVSVPAATDEAGFPERAPLSSWIALAILTAAYAVAFLDRIILSLMVDPIRQGLQISDAQVGLLQGVAFSLIYSLLGIPLGLAADRFHRVRILVIGMIVWSLANMACGLASGFEELFLARSLVGIGEAALAPVAASLIANLFPPSQRGIAFGIYVGGNSLGAILALSLGGFLFDAAAGLIASAPALFGNFDPWQMVFILTGLPGIAIALIAIFLLPEPPRIVATAANPFSKDGGGRLPIRLLAFLMLGGVFVATCPYAMIYWFPTVLMRVHGLSVDETGVLFGITSMGTGFVSSLISGWVIAYLTRRGRRDAALLTGMAAGGGYVLFGWYACLAGGPYLALAASALISVFSNWITPSILTALSIVTPARRLGAIVAVYTMLTGLLSMSIGSGLPGLLSSNVFTDQNGIAPSLAVVYAGGAMVGIVMFLIARPWFVKEVERGEAARV